MNTFKIFEIVFTKPFRKAGDAKRGRNKPVDTYKMQLKINSIS